MRSDEIRGEWRDLIVVSAGMAWDGPKMTDHHVAENLARWFPVLYVDPPISLVGARRASGAGASKESRLRQVAPSIAQLTPMVPPGVGRPGLRRIAEIMLRRRMREAAEHLGGDVLGVVAVSQHPVFGACGERHRLLYTTDDLVAGAELMGLSTRWLERCQRRLLAEADTVATTSPQLSEQWRSRGIPAHLVPNGVDHVFFAQTDHVAPAADVTLPDPIVGFVGHLSERIDVALLEAVADRGCSLLLVGPRQRTLQMERLDALLSRSNVQWVGSKPFGELPAYLRTMRVGVVPYGDTHFNRASFPLKALEYLAAGRGVVATDLPFVRWLDTDTIAVATEPERFADRVQSALAEELTPDAVASRREFASQHGWDRRARQLVDLLGGDASN